MTAPGRKVHRMVGHGYKSACGLDISGKTGPLATRFLPYLDAFLDRHGADGVRACFVCWPEKKEGAARGK